MESMDPNSLEAKRLVKLLGARELLKLDDADSLYGGDSFDEALNDAFMDGAGYDYDAVRDEVLRMIGAQVEIRGKSGADIRRQFEGKIQISKARVLQIIKEEVSRALGESYGDANDPYNPDADPDLVQREMGKPRAFTLPYKTTGYGGRQVISRDRAWLEFVPKGEPSRTTPDMFRSVTLLEPGDPEIQKRIERGPNPKNVEFAQAIENLDQYDVYSVYATTTG